MNETKPDTTLADKVMDTSADILCMLKQRWADEHKYEDFSEYAAAMAAKLTAVAGVSFVEMTKRPFGFKWRGYDGFKRYTYIKGRYIQTVCLAHGA